MTARYLLRLDDACATMDRRRWDAIEAMCDELAIKPIVAVVPDIRDPDLMCDTPDPLFWDRVRRWRGKGWSIAMHGYRHILHAEDRRRSLVPLNDRTEFAGLPYARQSELVRRAWAIFVGEGVTPDIWIGPAHSFDRETLRALREETSIRIVSDGIAPRPYRADEMMWLPQQLWRPERMPFGLWTICSHPNGMDETALAKLGATLATPYFRRRMTTVAQLPPTRRGLGLSDRLYHRYFFARAEAIRRVLPAYRLLGSLRTALK